MREEYTKSEIEEATRKIERVSDLALLTVLKNRKFSEETILALHRLNDFTKILFRHGVQKGQMGGNESVSQNEVGSTLTFNPDEGKYH